MKYDVCVVGGGGHVGLPLSIALADKGKNVVIQDINEATLERINTGELPFKEDGAEEKLRNVINKNLFTSSDCEVIRESEIIIVVIGTPVDEHLNPKFHSMKTFFEGIVPYLRNDHVVILRSTVYPQLTEKIRDILRTTHPDIEVTFCPERIAEGKAMEELYSLPQIVSGFDDVAVQKSVDLFSLLTEDILITTPLEAELAKLFTNSWRYLEFAAANQFYMIAETYNADFYKIFHVMKYKYPRTNRFPSPGFAAGPCLFKDTMQISAFAQNTFFLGHSAMLINEGLPNFVVKQFKQSHPLNEMTVGILGMAFKAESDDKRESLSYKLYKLLTIEAKAVLCSDVYIQDEEFVDEEALIETCDAIFIGAPHKKYKNLDFKDKAVIDVWNLIEGQ